MGAANIAIDAEAPVRLFAARWRTLPWVGLAYRAAVFDRLISSFADLQTNATEGPRRPAGEIFWRIRRNAIVRVADIRQGKPDQEGCIPL